MRLIALGALLLGASLPGSARAYDEAPVCVFPESREGAERRAPDANLDALCNPRDAESERPTPTAEAARDALSAAEAALADGRPGRAVLALETVRAAFPELDDRVSLWQADARMSADAPTARTCAAYERARESTHRATALRARVGHVECLLARHDRGGVEEYAALLRRYPELPQRAALSLALGAAHEGWDEPREAGRIYQLLDLFLPGTREAEVARARVERLLAADVRVRPHTPTQRVDRAERLLRSGPAHLARSTLAALQAERLNEDLRRRLAGFAARQARVEGRWDDANRLYRQAQGQGDLDDDDRERLRSLARDAEREAESREAGDVERRVRNLLGTSRLRSVGLTRLLIALRMAARGERADLVDDILAELVRRDLSSTTAFDAAVLAAGTGDDEHVLALFTDALIHPRRGTAARYHRARTLERLGRMGEARAEYAAVIAEDSPTLPYYATWSRTRVAALAPRPLGELSASAACDWSGEPVCEAAGKVGRRGEEPPAPDAAPAPDEDAAEPAPPMDQDDAFDIDSMSEELLDGEEDDDAPPPPPSRDEVIEILSSLAEDHGEGFPHFGRARALMLLERDRDAADEIHDAYVAWREASGQSRVRGGLESVFLLDTPPRRRVARATWTARRSFPPRAQAQLARAAYGLGEEGLAIRLVGRELTGPRPRAFRTEVETAARRYGVDPDLLHAVMRVESVYNPRVVSSAGAIGLMQIMPRTGQHIAHALGAEGFTTDRLLEPQLNVEFAAWYLASLITRWDGRLPLAIASYNGGPHNVRRWMRDHSASMPLDAFLERIPFAQTHRYVRRVLSHYAAYREQRGLGAPNLNVELPELRVDLVGF